MARQWQKEQNGDLELLIDFDEIVATFFIPLPDFLRFPDNLPLPTYRPLDTGASEWLRHFEEIPPRTDAEQSNPKYRNLVGAALLRSSTVFRRKAVNLDEASDLQLMAQMFEEFTPTKPFLSDTSKVNSKESGFFRSVAEVAVSIDSITLEMTIGDDRTPFRIRNKDHVTEEVISKALDIALEAVRSFQLGYYGATRESVTLIEREMLSPALLVSLQTLKEISEHSEVQPRMFVTGNIPSQIGLINDLTDDELLKVNKVLNSRIPLTRYLDLYRQGAVALRQGNTRECVVMMSVAAESLINVMLAHLQWEESITPELSASTWVPSLDARIKTVLPTKLGGNWDTTRPGAIHDWNQNIASIRHRVVHAGYKPTIAEARDAVSSLNGLVTFLGNRVVHNGNLKKYPRTALTLLGSEGLKRRDRYTRAVRELEKDRTEVKWDETFSRWYDTQILCIQDQKDPRQPDLTTSLYYIVFSSKDQYHWIASDWNARKAAKVKVTLAQGVPEPMEQLRKGVPSMQEGTTSYPLIVQVTAETVVTAELSGEWLENYHLMPLEEVMCDKSDFSR